MEPLRVLTPFSGVAFTAETVHRHRERLVRFRRDGTETHGAGAKAFDQLGSRLDLIQGYIRSRNPFAQRHQAAKRAAARRL